MHIDRLLQVSNKQAVTTPTVSTDTIDFGQVGPDLGISDLSMLITVDETATSAGATTVTFIIQDSDNNSTFSNLVTIPDVPKATLVAGYQFIIPMPARLRRYCRIQYWVTNGPLTTGRFSAGIVCGHQQNIAKPDSPRIG